MNAQPSVSVIIPHYNDLRGLAICLDALEKQSFPGEFEIVVADNRSMVGIEAVRAVAGERARVVDAPVQGAGPARNAAVEQARAPFLAFIDSDCVAEPAWLSEGIAALQDYDIVGGQVTIVVGHSGEPSGTEAFEAVFAFDNKKYIEKKNFSGSGNLFCPREVFDRAGPFRTGVSEDMEWCHRAISQGFSLGFAPLAEVGHPPRRNWSELVTKWRRINRESYGVMVEKPGGRLLWLLRTWLLLPSIPVDLWRILRTERLHSVAARLRACGTLTRIRLWRFANQHRLLFHDLGAKQASR